MVNALRTDKSDRLFAEAQKVIPGGVNSPVRAFRSVGRNPVFIEKGSGCYIWDADGNRYIDYVGSWGPLILGHAHPEVVAALKHAVERGVSFGAPTELEIKLAKLICAAVPSVEMVRMVNSGTEATMSALRLARGYTGRPKIVKFIGCYHGHADSLLIKAGSGATTFGVPDSPGVTPNAAQDTVSVPYNDLAAVKEVFRQFGEEIAAVIVEPVAGNMGVVPPKPGFLEGLREVTKEYGALLIFDEVMTGFRVAWGGAGVRFGIEADLTTFGKVIGGGLPVGAYGGKAEIMSQVSPAGPVYQAGTLSGNPLAMTAGITTLEILSEAGTYERLEELSKRLADGLHAAATEAGLPMQTNRVGAMFSIFFTDQEVVDFASAATVDQDLFGRYFRAMLAHGIYLAPSSYEAIFLSLAHTDEVIEQTLSAARKVFSQISK
ncbi:MAG: glutamate-1-semialdehyde 2,1-aminomutase [Firmicutes bacterium]|nr:glutamate-1-semialdehyde 2,1-aminomutase [Bacillota bacterium]